MIKEYRRNSPVADSPFNRDTRHDAKRAAILSQAARLFNSQGSRATTLKDIADTLGLTKTSLYYYVKTKEELIYLCYVATLERYHELLDEIELRHTSPLARIEAFFHQHFDNWLAAQEGRGPHSAALLEIASLKDPHRLSIENQYIAMFKRLRQFLRDGIAAGEVRPLETTSAARAILGSVDWVFSWLHGIPRDQVHAVAEQAFAILAHGLYAGEGLYQPASVSFRENNIFTAGFDREAQNLLKQRAFCRSGTRFFNKQGFNGTSLDEIAAQLEVSKGAFYYYIKNKEDLLYQCYHYSLEVIESIYREAGELPGAGMAKVDYACRSLFHAQNSSRGPLIRYNTITALPPPRRREILRRTEACNRLFGEFIRQGIADGSVGKIDPIIAQQLITGAANAAMDIQLWRRVDDIDVAAVEYFDIFFNGLNSRG